MDFGNQSLHATSMKSKIQLAHVIPLVLIDVATRPDNTLSLKFKENG